MARPTPVILRGSLLRSIRGPYAALILPVVALRKVFRLWYELIVHLMWSELIEGKPAESELLTLLAFLVLCLLSLLSFYLRAYNSLILIGCFLLWFIDYQLAKGQFLRGRAGASVSLVCRGDWVLWQRQAEDGSSDYSKFARVEVAQLSVQRTSVRGGAFRDVLGSVWQVYVERQDHSRLLFHESRSLIDALNQAKLVARAFAVPVVLLDSEGCGPYAAAALGYSGRSADPTLADIPNPIPNTIQCHSSPQQWHIYSQWRLSSTGHLLRQLAQRCGFLFFTLLVANLMLIWGGLLHGWGAFVLGFSDVWIISLAAPLVRWRMFLGLGLAASVLLIQAARLSREEHLYITRDTLTFCLNNKRIAQVPTAAIEAVLFVRQPFPAVWVITPDQAIEIRELQQENEFQMLALQINHALAVLRGK